MNLPGAHVSTQSIPWKLYTLINADCNHFNNSPDAQTGKANVAISDGLNLDFAARDDDVVL
jgi:hypothetical protein